MDSQIHPPNVSNFKEQHSQQAALSMTPSLGSLGGRFFSRSWRRHIWELDMTWHDMTSFESACMEFTLVFFHSMVLHTFGWMEVLVAGIRLVWAALHYPLQRWRQWWLLGLWDLEVCRCWFSIPLGNLHYRMGVYHPKVMPNGMIFSCCWLEFWYKIRMIIRSPHWFDWFSMNDSQHDRWIDFQLYRFESCKSQVKQSCLNFKRWAESWKFSKDQIIATFDSVHGFDYAFTVPWSSTKCR